MNELRLSGLVQKRHKNHSYHFMDKENEEVEEEETDDEVDDSDTTDWKFETMKLREKRKSDREKTKSLKDRIAELEKSPKAPEKSEEKSDEKVMKRLENLALKMAGITADDEVELYERWKKDTGRDADAVLGNKIFQAELDNIRTSRANAAAADVKGGGGEGGSALKNDPDYWISRATKDGEGKMMFPDDLPKDVNLRAAIVDKMGAASKGGGKFYNS